MDRQRVGRYIEKKGFQRNLSPGDWQHLVDFVLEGGRRRPWYRFCLVTQVEPPIKQSRGDFPESLLGIFDYLHIVDLFLVDEDRERLQSYLDQLGCPWEILWQYEPYTDSDDPIGLRIFGFDKGVSESS